MAYAFIFAFPFRSARRAGHRRILDGSQFADPDFTIVWFPPAYPLGQNGLRTPNVSAGIFGHSIGLDWIDGQSSIGLLFSI